ncbi:uncharacterized protein LOC128989286 [Macrosteles quadrilineatus]|uniref:uncharacterized protein LOC128989286 n=1 Tax=Macrosteles quadrilineatus TaxID=74068 RepID=UPI0023E124D7|nr:uncharacterized protein LOC128989286 [Macrosteles quadrilineatus]
MAVNPTKTKLITFSRKLNTVLADYSLDGNRVERCNTIKDLGVLIDSSFEFGPHINQICTRASRMLGLVFRSARHGLSNHACIILYKSLILQLLEYASLVWSPYHLGHIYHLQSVQRRFIRFLGCRAGLDFRDVRVDELSNIYDIPSLENRRRVADVTFLYKLINNQVNCPFLLERINFHVPSRITRHQRVFELDHTGTNYARSSPIPRIMRLGNVVSSSVDLLTASLGVVRRSAADCILEGTP